MERTGSIYHICIYINGQIGCWIAGWIIPLANIFCSLDFVLTRVLSIFIWNICKCAEVMTSLFFLHAIADKCHYIHMPIILTVVYLIIQLWIYLYVACVHPPCETIRRVWMLAVRIYNIPFIRISMSFVSRPDCLVRSVPHQETPNTSAQFQI